MQHNLAYGQQSRYGGYGQQAGYGGGYSQQLGGGGFQAAPPQGPPPGADPQLWTWFNSVDSDRSGSISAPELQQALFNGDWSPFDLDTVKMLITMFDTDRSGCIGFNEFSGLWRYIRDWQNFWTWFNANMVSTFRVSSLLSMLTNTDAKASAPIPGGPPPSITFDRFVRACVVITSLVETFRRMDTDRDGLVQINCDAFVHAHVPDFNPVILVIFVR
ncbi:hypothetical protein FRC10_006320 [Ceratobasidium sp. 414]|nr:hypothetical protein FRC10_006320 [Ceratobasidium sp. 414]